MNENIKTVILAGGLGTRLRTVISDRPKVLAPIGDVTVLDLMIENLAKCGLYDIVLATGHMKEKVREHLDSAKIPEGVTISFSEEDSPLGTGGAAKKALSGHEGPSLIINGDIIFQINYRDLIKKHCESGAEVSLALREMEDTGRYGTVIIDDKKRIMSFKEKSPLSGKGSISGGVYFFNGGIFDKTGLTDSFSIEKDFFEKYLDKIIFHGFHFEEPFVDIGVPEDYHKANSDYSS